MLPIKNRLKKKSAFTATYHAGKAFHKGGISMYLGRKLSTECETKIGFVVSKKTHKRAVKRNRLKRLMRESVRLLIKSGVDFKKTQSIIFVGKSYALDKSFNEIDSIIKNLLGEIK